MSQVAFINGNKEATSSPVCQGDYLIYCIESIKATIQVHFYDRSCEGAIIRLATYCVSDEVNNVDVYYNTLLENTYSINAFM